MGEGKRRGDFEGHIRSIVHLKKMKRRESGWSGGDIYGDFALRKYTFPFEFKWGA